MIANIQCLTEACDHLAIPYRFLDKNRNFVEIGSDKKCYFSNCSTPLNSEQVSTICKDKEFTYDLLNSVIRMPKTKGYFDPFRSEFIHYARFANLAEITKDIVESFTLNPSKGQIIIKRNGGFQAKNVFLCNSQDEILKALTTIFDQQSKEYDFVALAQEYVKPVKELRVATLKGKATLVYDWSNDFEIIEPESDLFKKIEVFISPIFTKLDLVWSGLDIILDENNNLHLIELNSKPGFENFIHARGKEKIVEMYETMLKKLVSR